MDKLKWEKLDFPEFLFDYILEKCDNIKKISEVSKENPKIESINTQREKIVNDNNNNFNNFNNNSNNCIIFLFHILF